MIEVLLIGTKGKRLARLKDHLGRAGDMNLAIAPTLDKALGDDGIRGDSVVLVGPGMSLDGATGFLGRLSVKYPRAGCIFVSPTIDTDLVYAAFRAGFKDVVLDDPVAIEGTIRRVHGLMGEMAGNGGKAQETRGRVITFLSPKGGAGKTVFATNTGVGLAMKSIGSVLILDLDHQFGDVGVLLGMPPEPNVSSLMPVADRLDRDMLSSAISTHNSGLSVLLAPAQSHVPERMTQQHVNRLVQVARTMADFVIVDTAAYFEENTTAILSNSDCVFLITALDVPSVKNAYVMLQTLRALKFPEERIKVLLNRADSKVSLLPSQVEKHLKHPIAVQIPSDGAVPRSVNEGVPLIAGGSKRPIVAALEEIVSLVKSVKPRDSKDPISEREL